MLDDAERRVVLRFRETCSQLRAAFPRIGFRLVGYDGLFPVHSHLGRKLVAAEGEHRSSFCLTGLDCSLFGNNRRLFLNRRSYTAFEPSTRRSYPAFCLFLLDLDPHLSQDIVVQVHVVDFCFGLLIALSCFATDQVDEAGEFFLHGFYIGVDELRPGFRVLNFFSGTCDALDFTIHECFRLLDLIAVLLNEFVVCCASHVRDLGRLGVDATFQVVVQALRDVVHLCLQTVHGRFNARLYGGVDAVPDLFEHTLVGRNESFRQHALCCFANLVLCGHGPSTDRRYGNLHSAECTALHAAYYFCTTTGDCTDESTSCERIHNPALGVRREHVERRILISERCELDDLLRGLCTTFERRLCTSGNCEVFDKLLTNLPVDSREHLIQQAQSGDGFKSATRDTAEQSSQARVGDTGV